VRLSYWMSFFILLFLHLNISAQVPDFKFRHLTVKDGFSVDDFGALCRDHRGFLWVATYAGLNRYDGHHVTIFRNNPDDPHSIAAITITNIVEDSLGQIWVGSINGFVSRYDYATNSFTNFNLKSPTDSSYFRSAQTCFLFACVNDVWVLRNDRLYHFDRKSNQFISFDTTKLISRVGKTNFNAFAISPDKKIYFRLHSELMVMNSDGSNLHYYFSDTADSHFFNTLLVSGLCAETSGNIWFSEWKRSHSYYYSKSDHSFQDLFPGIDPLASNVVTGFVPYNEHWMIGSTYASGLWLIDRDTKKIVKYYHYDPQDPYALSTVAINYTLLDNQGTLWVSGTGLNYFNPVNFQFRFIPKDPRPVPDYKRTTFMDACEDSDHHLWFGEFIGGVNEYFPDSSHLLRYSYRSKDVKVMNNNSVYTLFNFDRNHLMVTFQNGISLFDLRTKQISDTLHFPGEAGILSQHSTVRILRDKNGNLWLATARNGILLFNPKTNVYTHFCNEASDAKDRTSGEWISQMATDSKGNIWVTAKEYYGVMKINPDSLAVKSFPFSSALFQKTGTGLLYDMAVDGDSVLWLGTWGYGLLKYEIATGKITIYDVSKGLCNNIVSSMALDHRHNLWISTPNGLSNFDTKKKRFRNFFAADGLPQEDLGNFTYCAMNGKIYIGAADGVVEFDPDSLLQTLPPPSTIIASVLVNGKEMSGIQSTKNIDLSYSQRNVSFEFNAINFFDPEHDQYSYRLVGYDHEWNNAGSREYAAYTNLPGGDYTFEVRAANIDGVWNSAPTSIQLHIDTPFYLRWWFFVLIVILASAVLYLIYRIRLNRLLAIERIRTHISRDLHDDVGSALSSINIWSEVAEHQLKSDPDKSEEYLKRIHNSSQNMLDTMSDIIWAINPINDTVEKLLARMKHYAAEMLEPKNIHFDFTVSDQVKKVPIPMQYRRELYLIFKEAINNAAKYSEANKISVSITANRHRLAMDIRDNGKGFDLEDKSRGNGLRNMRARAKNMNAEINFASSPEKGTQIFLHQRFTRSGEVTN